MAKKKKNTTRKQKAPTEFSDGVDHLAKESEQARDLEQLMGFKEKNPFGYNSEKEFAEAMDQMMLTSLQEIAVKAGVFPSGTKAMLKTKLKKAYLQYTTGGSNKVVQVTNPIVDPESEKGKNLLKIINEGL